MERPDGFTLDMAPSIVPIHVQRPSISRDLPMSIPDFHYSSMSRPSGTTPSFARPVTASLESHTRILDTSPTPPTEGFPLPQPTGVRHLPQLPKSYYNLPHSETASMESLPMPPFEAPYTVTRFGPKKQHPSRRLSTDCPFSRIRADNPNVPLCQKVQKTRQAVI